MTNDFDKITALGCSDEALLAYFFHQRCGIASSSALINGTKQRAGDTIIMTLQRLEAKHLIKKIGEDTFRLTTKARWERLILNPALNFWIAIMTALILILTLILIMRNM